MEKVKSTSKILYLFILLLTLTNCKFSKQEMNNKQNKLTEQDILNTLDNSNDGYYCSFIELDQAYSYLIDTRLNVFTDNNNHWAIAVERLGYNPRQGFIGLEISYFGNCLENLEKYNGRNVNTYMVYPINDDNFEETTEMESLKPDAKYWIVRNKKVNLSHNKQEYLNAGIVLEEYEPNEISIEEAGRFIVTKNSKLFRATNKELYKSIPKNLKKILVLNEWYHKDYSLQLNPKISKEQMKGAYENLQNNKISYDDFEKSVNMQLSENEKNDNRIKELNRPSIIETWKLIAKVIISNNPKLYKPKLKPNTHWKNWLNSGSL